MIATARGQIEPHELGVVLPHEHVLINLMRERRSDGLLSDEALMTEELAVFRAQGGGTVVDLSSNDLTTGSTAGAQRASGATRDSRNVEAIQRISELTGLHVVLGTGHYRDPYLDTTYIDSHSVDQIADDLVRDLVEGFPGTTARAGVIGEIGSDAWYISAREERSFRAAARASRRTGAGLYTHAARWPVGGAQLDLLAEEDVPAERIAVGHVDTVNVPGYALELAARGVYLGIDTMYESTDRAIEWRVDLVMSLVRAGHADQILLSHDVCVGSQLAVSGGPGFGHVLGTFRDRLEVAGLPGETFDHITVANPARFLNIS
jgi:predicted metal-dependent phosphotriesterase family hydrolase